MYLILLIRLFYNEPLSGAWTTFIFVTPLVLNPHLSIFRTFSGSILTLCIHLSSTCHYTSKRNHCLVMSLSKHSWTTPQFPHTSAHCCLCRRPTFFFGLLRLSSFKSDVKRALSHSHAGLHASAAHSPPACDHGEADGRLTCKLDNFQHALFGWSAWKWKKLERYCVIFVIFVAFLQYKLSKQLQNYSSTSIIVSSTVETK